MTPDYGHGKRAAQQRVERIRAFREELKALESENALALTPEQRQAVDAHLERTLRALSDRFDIDATESEKRISWGMRIASTIGALALCAALVLFFYRIWGSLAIPIQVAALALTPLAAIAGMEFASRRERTLYYTGLLGVLAFSAAVLNLNALTAMFNAAPSPNGFLVWGLFGLGLAYAYRLRLLLAAGLVCLIVFLAMRLASLTGLYWGAIDARVEHFIAGGALALALPRFVRHQSYEDFPWVYHMTGLSAALLAMLVGSVNGRNSWLPFEPRTVEAIYITFGLLTAGAAIWQGILRRIPGVVNLGAGAFVLFLYIRLFKWWWEWMPKYLFFFLIGVISLALLYAFQRARRHLKEARA